MKNFIFKSNSRFESDLYKIYTQLNLLLTEQRQQRIDLSKINKLIKGLIALNIPEPNNLEEQEEIATSDTDIGE